MSLRRFLEGRGPPRANPEPRLTVPSLPVDRNGWSETSDAFKTMGAQYAKVRAPEYAAGFARLARLAVAAADGPPELEGILDRLARGEESDLGRVAAEIDAFKNDDRLRVWLFKTPSLRPAGLPLTLGKETPIGWCALYSVTRAVDGVLLRLRMSEQKKWSLLNNFTSLMHEALSVIERRTDLSVQELVALAVEALDPQTPRLVPGDLLVAEKRAAEDFSVTYSQAGPKPKVLARLKYNATYPGRFYLMDHFGVFKTQPGTTHTQRLFILADLTRRQVWSVSRGDAGSPDQAVLDEVGFEPDPSSGETLRAWKLALPEPARAALLDRTRFVTEPTDVTAAYELANTLYGATRQEWGEVFGCALAFAAERLPGGADVEFERWTEMLRGATPKRFAALRWMSTRYRLVTAGWKDAPSTALLLDAASAVASALGEAEWFSTIEGPLRVERAMQALSRLADVLVREGASWSVPEALHQLDQTCVRLAAARAEAARRAKDGQAP